MERQDITLMTDSEKINEILTTMRALADAMQELGNNPMLKALMPKGLGI
jgi:hypothetical protein